METLEKNKSKIMLQRSLEDLHREENEWISEIQFWDMELNFFQKLLNKSNVLSVDNFDMKIMEGLEGKLIQFKKEAIDTLLIDIEDQEDYFGHLLEEKVGYDPSSYREQNHLHAMHMNYLRKKFVAFKKELFAFMEALM
jgi:hypothetical protein